MFRYVFLCLVFVLATRGQAQIFRWQNPYPRDIPRQDSLYKEVFNRKILVRDSSLLIPRNRGVVYTENKVKPSRQTVLDSELRSSGSLVRGISFGTNQGQGVQSKMNLELEGKLSEDVRVRAVVNDTNLPIQADGYTQTLREFNQIFIELFLKNHTQIQGGHIDLLNTKDYFASYQRRSMGVGFRTQISPHLQLAGSGGIARSDFHRMRIQGIEGNQGPYRLQGRNGEVFIQILAGSEQVFLNGVPLVRGEGEDYTLNYNTGEISFTARRPIQRQHFISVSYSYAARGYSRSLFQAEANYTSKNWQIRTSGFWEQDDPNAPLSVELRPQDIQLMKEANADEQQLYVPSGVPSVWDANKVLYEYQKGIYVHSVRPDQELYQVTFSFFGEGRGDYSIQSERSNTRIYHYVGDGKGEYRAVRPLTTPERSHLYSLSSVYRAGKNEFSLDASLSRRSSNLFRQQGDKIASAIRLNYTTEWKKEDWTLRPEVSFQRIAKGFHILDRIQGVEFARDFNLDKEYNGREQVKTKIFVSIQKQKNLDSGYQLDYLQEKEAYSGQRHQAWIEATKGKYNLQTKVSLLKTASLLEDTQFRQHALRIQRANPLLYPAIYWRGEQNLRYQNKDTGPQIDRRSFRWKELGLEFSRPDSVRWQWGGRLYTRHQDSVMKGDLTRFQDVLGAEARIGHQDSLGNRWKLHAHYRKLENRFDLGQNIPAVMLGWAEVNQNLFNQSLYLRGKYQLGSGQDAQREFQYVRVTDGTGIYRWTDYNGDATQQLDEFEVAEFRDTAHFIRVYTPNVRYLPSLRNLLDFGLTWRLQPYPLPTTLKRLSLSAQFNAQNVYQRKDRHSLFNPLYTEEDQLAGGRIWSADITWQDPGNFPWSARVLASGNEQILNANLSKEQRLSQSQEAYLNYRKGDISLDLTGRHSRSAQTSQGFQNRNFVLETYRYQPRFRYQWSDAIDADLNFEQKFIVQKQGTESLQSTQIGTDFHWTLPKAQIRINYHFVNNRFQGDPFSLVANQMLEGLQPGNNQVWGVQIQMRITSFLNLEIQYDGRQSGGKTIHLGSTQLKASF